ncbi:MAG: protein kinase [Polyangiaceae bacterium]
MMTAAPLAPSLHIGSQVGGYEIVQRLGAGGMAEVYLAMQHGPSGFRRRVVLKRVHPHLAEEPDFVEMFMAEAGVAATLSHPNIVHVYEFFETEGSGYFLVLEYVPGYTVHRLVRDLKRKGKRVPIDVAVRIAIAVCEALEYAYNVQDADGDPMHIVHRDVSPSNVLVGMDGQVRLFDFGIARVLSRASSTMVGQLKGKYRYMSPEQARSQPLDQRSDLFSVGVMLYEMTTLRYAFRGATHLETITAVTQTEPPAPSSLVPGFPPALEQVILRALSKQREGRFASARDMARALEACAQVAHPQKLEALMQEVFPDGPPDQAAAPATPTSLSSPASSGLIRRPPPTPSGPFSQPVPEIIAPMPGVSEPPRAEPELPSPVTEASGGATPQVDWLTWGALAAFIVLSILFWVLVYPRFG